MKESVNKNENHPQMRIGLSNSLEPVQTRNQYKLGISTNQGAVQNRNQPKTGVSTMNECKTCKHYRPIEKQAGEDMGDCTLYPEWREVLTYHYCGQWTTTAQKEETPSPLNIDWSQVPEGYDWVAQDGDGEVLAYDDEPMTGKYQWVIVGGDITIFHHHIPLRFNPNWRDTLTKRPGT